MKKLVRDKIPEFATEATYRELPKEEIEPALKNKLIEELGDVYEVLTAYLKFKGVSQEEFLKLVATKRDYKGGFTKFLEMTTKD